MTGWRTPLRAAVATVLVGLALVPVAGASPQLQLGILDDAQVLGAPERTVPLLEELGVEILRINLRWDHVGKSRPARGADPNDASYDWSVYDRALAAVAAAGIEPLVSIVGTPGWANGRRAHQFAPRKPRDLRAFSQAAATRYSGTFQLPDGTVLPRVVKWTAWNEPNLHTWLRPQYVRVRASSRKRKFIQASPKAYAKICNAVVDGVHASGERLGIEQTVACGVTAPGGENRATARSPGISPIPFLRGVFRAGARPDVYAHHPYAGRPSEAPPDLPRERTRITLGNLWALLLELNTTYGKDMRLWLTEYGYQTSPPDRISGIKPKLQAEYLRRAFEMMHLNERVDVLIWFLLVDEPARGTFGTDGWQSGLITTAGKRKPAFDEFLALARA